MVFRSGAAEGEKMDRNAALAGVCWAAIGCDNTAIDKLSKAATIDVRQALPKHSFMEPTRRRYHQGLRSQVSRLEIKV
jgi:hypothetical protein